MSSVSNGYQLKNLMRNLCYRRAFVSWLWDSCLNTPPLHNWWPALPQLPCHYLHKGSGDCLSTLKLTKLILHSFLRLHLSHIFFQIYLVFLSGHRNCSLQLRPPRRLLQSSAFKLASVYTPQWQVTDFSLMQKKIWLSFHYFFKRPLKAHHFQWYILISCNN